MVILSRSCFPISTRRITWHAGWFATLRLPRTSCRTPTSARASTSDRFAVGPVGRWLLQIVRNTAYSTLKAERQRMQVSLNGGTFADGEGGVDMDMPDPSPG